MKEEALYVYDELLKLGLVDVGFHQKMKTKIGSRKVFSTRELFSFALNLSIAGMVRTSAAFGFDEEHLTASLAGSLESNLTWFSRAYIKSKGTRMLPQLQWIHQTKISEARSGVDFGLLSRVPGGGSGKRYRLILMQAKLGNPKDRSIKVDHVTNKHAVEGTLQWSEDAKTLLQAATRFRRSERVTDDLMHRATEIAHKKFKRGEPRYQLETLLRTDFRGRSLSDDDRPWCFYVAWHSSSMPQAEDVRRVASTVWSSGSNPPLDQKLSDTAGLLTSLFDEALYEKESRYGLELSADRVASAVEYLEELAPDVRLLANTVDPELKKIFHWSKYRISDTLIPLDLLQRQQTAVFAARAAAAAAASAFAESDPGGLTPDNPEEDVENTNAGRAFDPSNGG